MIFHLKKMSVFSLLIILSLPLFGQTAEEKTMSDKKGPFLGFTDNHDVYTQLYLGLGYSFYNMKNETERISLLQDENFNVEDMSGSFSFNGGIALTLRQPEIRILLDYRGDGYSNTSGIHFDFSFDDDAKTSYELDHNIYNLSIGAEKLIFNSESNDSYFGFGGSYIFIRDIRTEKLRFRSGGSDKSAKTTADILAKALEVHISIGGVRQGHVFGEARIGYQFQQSFTIQSNKNKPGQSTAGYTPDFNSFTFKLVVGILL